jgi:PAS domain S-box-containing protein
MRGAVPLPISLPLEVLDNLLEGCQVIGPDFRYLYVNNAVCEHGRQPRDRLLGRRMMEVYPGIENTEMFATLKRCMDERIPQQMENEFTYPDGSTGWFELRFSPAPEGAVILSLDITERKRTLETVEHLNTVLRGIRNINQLITREREIGTLLETACSCLVEAGSYPGVWIALVEGEQEVEWLTQAGVREQLPGLWKMIEGGKLPTCALNAIKEQETIVCSSDSEMCKGCPAQGERAPEHDMMTSILSHDERLRGFISAMVPRRFGGAEEMSLFEEAAGDVSFALQAIEREGGEQRKMADLEFLGSASRELLGLSPGTDLYKHVADTLCKLVGESYVFVNEVDDDQRSMLCRAECGLGTYTAKTLELLGRHPVGMRLPLEEEARQELLTGKLVEVAGGIHTLTFGQVPRAVCRMIEKQLGIGRIYSVGFRDKGRLIGNASILVRGKGDIVSKRTVEAFVGLAATAMLRQCAEEALQKSEAFFKALVDAAPDSVTATDLSGKIISVSPTTLQLHGYDDEDEILGRSALELIVPAEHDRAEQGMKTTLEEGAVRNTEYRLLRRDGSTFHGELSASLMRDASGQPSGFVAIVRDVTDQKELEDQLRQAQKMEAIGKLAGGVAHDFNNILGTIIGYSDMLLEDLGDNHPLREDIENMLAAAERASTLTRQLLAFSRKQVLETKVLSLNEVVTETRKMLIRLIGEDVEIVTTLQPDLGLVKADPGQVEQILMNLAVNARDAMPDGGKLIIETREVELDEEYAGRHMEVIPGTYIMLAMSDSGHGIERENLSRIFEPFFTTKERGKGTGLGLSTVYGIVKQSGGHIWAYSEPGKGTIFKIYLPRVEPVAEKKERRPPTISPKAGSETVLVTEDDDTLRTLLCRMLEGGGYKVLEARHGVEALDISAQTALRIHLLVTDVIMPRMSGRELADKLSQRRPEIKILYVSGYTDDAIAHQGVLDEGIHFIEKPFSVKTLLKKVREVLDES